jgi:hypothetical protein
MKFCRKILWIGVIAVGMLASADPARAEHTRVTNPNALNVEVFGRGLLYSVNFDRVVSDDLVAGIGFGSTSMRTLDDQDPGVTATLVPVYVNYYFMRDQGSLYVTAGADVVTNSSDLKGLKSTYGGMQFNANAVLPTFGLGYENRGDYGFLFRVAAYGVVAKSVNPWFGFTLGWAF